MPDSLTEDAADLLLAICRQAFGPGAQTRQGFVFRLQIEDATGLALLSQPHVGGPVPWSLETSLAMVERLQESGFFERAPHGVRRDGFSIARAGVTPLGREWFARRDKSI